MTAILTQRCDPFGVETERYGERLAGGLFPDAKAGNNIWHCENPVVGRYRMVCQGGDYGFRRANDGGIVEAHHCPGGHRGQVMALCKIHVREFNIGPPKPGWNRDRTVPHGQVGGTVANEMCPACVAPPQAREFMVRADFLQQQLSQMKQTMNMVLIPRMLARAVAIESELDQVRAALNDLHERGIVHKCPLRLVEVS